MKPPDREAFFRWYHAEKSKGTEFDMQRDLVAYCEMDVEILMQGAMKFRRQLLDLHELDPFVSASTIASTCMAVFRKCFLEEETIGIVPHGGYRKSDRHSVIAMKWLKWQSHISTEQIQHARNGGEVSSFHCFFV